MEETADRNLDEFAFSFRNWPKSICVPCAYITYVYLHSIVAWNVRLNTTMPKSVFVTYTRPFVRTAPMQMKVFSLFSSLVLLSNVFKNGES